MTAISLLSSLTGMVVMSICLVESVIAQNEYYSGVVSYPLFVFSYRVAALIFVKTLVYRISLLLSLLLSVGLKL